MKSFAREAAIVMLGSFAFGYGFVLAVYLVGGAS